MRCQLQEVRVTVMFLKVCHMSYIARLLLMHFGQQSVRLSWEKVTKLIITSSARRTERSLWMLLIEIGQQQLTHTQTVQRSARKEVRCASGGQLPQLLVLTTLHGMSFKFLQDAELCGHVMATGNWCTQYACMMSQKKYWAFLDN